jgi:hypothetical protein
MARRYTCIAKLCCGIRAEHAWGLPMQVANIHDTYTGLCQHATCPSGIRIAWPSVNKKGNCETVSQVPAMGSYYGKRDNATKAEGG